MSKTEWESHLVRQMVFSRATFGPGQRTSGVIDHIRKELVEVEDSNGSPSEWTDVVILALDGLLRELWAGNPMSDPHDVASMAIEFILRKQAKNERRNWPDWRTAPNDKAIEHDKDPTQ